MKIVFIGTSELALPALKELLEHGHEILAVVTQPDRVSGRGKSIHFSPVKEEALQQGLLVLQPERIGTEEFQTQMQKLMPDLFVVASYGQKIPSKLMDVAPFGCINIHPSLLPKYRGALPLAGPILNGDEKTGVTIMRLSDQLDAGNILAQETYTLDPKETVLTLEPKLSCLGAKLLLSVVEQMENGTVEEKRQIEEDATYIGQITKEDGRIDFSESAQKIERMIRAFTPWPSAYTALDNKTFKIWAADVTAIEHETAAEPGIVIYVDKKNLMVQCGKDALSLKEVQIEGKKKMTIEEFLRGKKIETGMHLG